jgi:hypothetical protein
MAVEEQVGKVKEVKAVVVAEGLAVQLKPSKPLSILILVDLVIKPYQSRNRCTSFLLNSRLTDIHSKLNVDSDISHFVDIINKIKAEMVAEKKNKAYYVFASIRSYSIVSIKRLILAGADGNVPDVKRKAIEEKIDTLIKLKVVPSLNDKKGSELIDEKKSVNEKIKAILNRLANDPDDTAGEYNLSIK